MHRERHEEHRVVGVRAEDARLLAEVLREARGAAGLLGVRRGDVHPVGDLGDGAEEVRRVQALGEDPLAAVAAVGPRLQDRLAALRVADEADGVRVALEQLVERGRVVGRLGAVRGEPERLAVERVRRALRQALAVGVVDVQEGRRLGLDEVVHDHAHHDALLDVVRGRPAEVLHRLVVVVAELGQGRAGRRRADLHDLVRGDALRQRHGHAGGGRADEADDALLAHELAVLLLGRLRDRLGITGEELELAPERAARLVDLVDGELDALLHARPEVGQVARDREDRGDRDRAAAGARQRAEAAGEAGQADRARGPRELEVLAPRLSDSV